MSNEFEYLNTENIVKALELCINGTSELCRNCPFGEVLDGSCTRELMSKVLNIVNSQKDENRALKNKVKKLKNKNRVLKNKLKGGAGSEQTRT